jgi:hypothetical protein
VVRAGGEVVLRLQSRARMLRTFIVVTLAGAAACAGPEPSSRSHTDGKLSSNGLVLHADVLARLSADPLGGGAAAELAETDDGRALLEYVVRCALPEGDGITVGGVTYDGALGLAAAWRETACDGACRRWVSACLLAHANVAEVHVPIWLRASHPQLGDGGGEAFTYQEGAFYGDVFGGRAEMYACVGRGVIGNLPMDTVTMIDDVAEYFRHRLCKLEGECGITPTGICGGGPEEAPAACTRDAGERGAFGGCGDGFATRDGQPAGATWSEVITVYLEP